MKSFKKAMLAPLATAALGLVASVAPASASIITYTYDFTENGSLASTSADTVTVTEDTSLKTLAVDVNFAPTSAFFVTTGGRDNSVLWFSVNTSTLADTAFSNFTIDNAATTDLAVSNVNDNNPAGPYYPNGKGNGFFNYVLSCSTMCSPSNTSGPNQISFTISYASIGTSPFLTEGGVTPSNGVYFVADVNDGHRSTGRVGATLVPEPMTLLLFGSGLAGLAALRRRRRI